MKMINHLRVKILKKRLMKAIKKNKMKTKMIMKIMKKRKATKKRLINPTKKMRQRKVSQMTNKKVNLMNDCT